MSKEGVFFLGGEYGKGRGELECAGQEIARLRVKGERRGYQLPPPGCQVVVRTLKPLFCGWSWKERVIMVEVMSNLPAFDLFSMSQSNRQQSA